MYVAACDNASASGFCLQSTDPIYRGFAPEPHAMWALSPDPDIGSRSCVLHVFASDKFSVFVYGPETHR
jgi:hypothetical protein